MKTSTKILLAIALALFLAAFMILDTTFAIAATGICVFCFLADREFRRLF